MCGCLIPHYHCLAYYCYGLSSVSYFIYLIKLSGQEKEKLPSGLLAVFPSSKNYRWRKWQSYLPKVISYLVGFVEYIFLIVRVLSTQNTHPCTKQEERPIKRLWFWGSVSMSFFLEKLIQVKKAFSVTGYEDAYSSWQLLMIVFLCD